MELGAGGGGASGGRRVRNGSSVRVVSRTLTARFDWRDHECVINGLYMLYIRSVIFWTESKKSIAIFRCVS